MGNLFDYGFVYPVTNDHIHDWHLVDKKPTYLWRCRGCGKISFLKKPSEKN